MRVSGELVTHPKELAGIAYETEMMAALFVQHLLGLWGNSVDHYTMHMVASDEPPYRWLDRPVDQIVCPTCRKALSIQLAYGNGTRGGLQAQPLRRANNAVP